MFPIGPLKMHSLFVFLLPIALYLTGFWLVDVLAYDPSTTHLTLLDKSALS
jgi:hypothetical protein